MEVHAEEESYGWKMINHLKKFDSEYLIQMFQQWYELYQWLNCLIRIDFEKIAWTSRTNNHLLEAIVVVFGWNHLMVVIWMSY